MTKINIRQETLANPIIVDGIGNYFLVKYFVVWKI